jgi:hypothetical protein
MMFSSAIEGGIRRPDGQHGAGKPFAEIVVGISFDPDGDARGAESEETLAGAADRVDHDGIAGQPGVSVASGDFIAEAGAQGSPDIRDRQVDFYGRSPFKSRQSLLDQVVVRRIVRIVHQPPGDAQPLDVRRWFGPMQDGAQIQAPGLPVTQG